MFRSRRPSRSSSHTIIGLAFATAVALIGATAAPDARAADDAELVSLTCANGKVTVTAKDVWYVNDKAPWKWNKGALKSVSAGDHEKRGPNHGTAVFEGTACEGTVKAFICNGDQCKGPIAVVVR